MSQQQKLEKVLDLLLSEDSDKASELLHQIIVEKARVIYESIVEEEDDEEKEDVKEANDVVGGEPSKDFTDEISSDEEDIESEEESDGEAGADEEDSEYEELDDEESDEDMDEEDVEDRVEDLESQLAELRAEFDALMGEEMMEPHHADLGDEMAEIQDEFDDEDEMSDMPNMSGDTKVVGEVVATMFEKKKAAKKPVEEKEKMEVAKQAKKHPKGKKVEEETQFLHKVADTGQKGTAKLVGTGKDTPLGAEQGKSVFTKAPSKPNYGGNADNILGSKSTGGEYGKYHGDSAKDETPSNNVNVAPKKTSEKADNVEGKLVGTGKGSQTGKTDVHSPLSKAPSKPGLSR